MANQYGAPDRTPLLSGRELPGGAGSGIAGASGGFYYTSVLQIGQLIYTNILVDLTGLNSGGTAGDIIGKNSAANSHLGQITTLVNGTIIAGSMTCLETPAGGEPNIDLFAATESTGTEDAAAGATLTETALLESSGDWIATGALTVQGLSAVPAADKYLYLVAGDATDATYTAGKFLIQLIGLAS